MFPFEGLGMGAVVGATRGVADMAYCCTATMFLHDRFILCLMVQTKGFDHRSNLLERIKQARAGRIECCHSSSKLATILQVEQHPWNQAGHLFWAGTGCQTRWGFTWQVIDGSDTAIVAQFVAGFRGALIRRVHEDLVAAPGECLITLS